MKIDLSGLTILVTGASGGIGYEIASQCLKAGANVAIHYNKNQRSLASLAEEYQGHAILFQTSFDDPQTCKNLFEQVTTQFSKVDVIVNNAGIYQDAPLNDPVTAWIQKWNRTIQVNLTATAILCRSAIQHFIKQGGGRIINIASRAAFRGDTPDHLAYAASKGGMISLTRSIARGFGKQGIKAFAVAPGFVRTEMAQAYFDQHGEEGVLAELSLSNLTEVADIAPFVVLLASGLADHATGSTIDINGGSYVR